MAKDEETFSVASKPEQEKKSLEFLENARRSKDEDGVISVSPGKQYVRGNTRGEKINTAREASNSAAEKRGEALDKMLREGHSPKNQAEYDDAYKKSSMLQDAYSEEVDKGYKSGGSVSMKGGGSVRGAGLAQRGQGKMRMF